MQQTFLTNRPVKLRTGSTLGRWKLYLWIFAWMRPESNF